MSNIFVLTAGNPAARQRLRDTVENTECTKSFGEEEK